MPKKPNSPLPSQDLPPLNVDTPDEGSLDFDQSNHDALVQHVSEDAWVDHWMEVLDKQAQGMQMQRLDQ